MWDRAMLLLLLMSKEAGYVFKLGGCLDNLEAKNSVRKGIQ